MFELKLACTNSLDKGKIKMSEMWDFKTAVTIFF